MAIEFNGLQSTQTNGTRAKAPSPDADASTAKKQPETTQSAAPDTVKLSSEAQTLKKLEAQVADLPDVNADRIAEIKAAVDSGNYKVDLEGVARKLIQLEVLFEG